MTNNTEALTVAEKFLDEMIAADAANDYEAFIRPFVVDEEFTREKFEADVAEMQAAMGEYKSREYLGSLKGNDTDHKDSLRFVWKGFYEKEEALMVVGICQIDGDWFAIEGMWH